MKRKLKGFTLVELVITIAIVVILSVVSVPIYRNYTEKAKMTEGYALMGTILAAQKAYYSEYGYFYQRQSTQTDWTSFIPELGIDSRGNRYFSLFTPSRTADGDPRVFFHALAPIPSDLVAGKENVFLRLAYNITHGIAPGTDGHIDVVY